MKLEDTTQLQQSQVNTSVSIAVQKKAMEQEEQVLKLVHDLPRTSSPGVGGGVDVTV
ncbi:MAG: putative motility protein [Fibrobacteria bacterium]|nr:putative motility protein [Fibrobacteria bacterium]